VPDKAERVRHFHDSTLAALAELICAAGHAHPQELRREQILKRLPSGDVKSFADFYPELTSGELLSGTGDLSYKALWERAQATSFLPKVLMAAAG